MTYDEFAEIIEPLYRQFRPKMPADWKAKDLGDKYRVVGRFRAEALRATVDVLLAKAEQMPPPARIRSDVIEATARLFPEPPADYKPWDDPLHCPCGCGGERWSSVILDRKTKEPMSFPDNAEAMGVDVLAALSPGLRANVAAHMLKLAGKLKTRDRMHCKRHAVTPESKRGQLLKTDSRGVRVYMPNLTEEERALVEAQRVVKGSNAENDEST